MSTAAQRAADAAARGSYGRLVAILAARSSDIAAAEDWLSTAFLAALKTWPERGIPANPQAWLIATARNAARNAARHGKVTEAAKADVERQYEELAEMGDGFRDERLKMLFVCAHPAINPAVRTPLMLQAVLGLDAARIAAAFLVAPATMGQRLVRAKAKIRDSGIRFAVPEPEQLAERLDDVLNAIYAAFGTGWDAVPGADEGVRGLSDEAIYLGRLVVSLLPAEPEARGLLSLMLYCDARRLARRDPLGRFTPLNRQDASLWSQDKIVEAERLLISASKSGRFGRFQCEAAIQSVHVQRPITGSTNYAALRQLYDMLFAHAPSLGVIVSRAAVICEGGEPAQALSALDAVPRADVATYQPYWVTRSRILSSLGRAVEAQKALDIAIGLTEDESVRTYLMSKSPSAPGLAQNGIAQS